MIALALGAAGLAACGSGSRSTLVPGADPSRGKKLVEKYGCGTCHEIGGVRGASGRVGPSLNDLRDRAFIAGRLPNTPANAARWIQHPQQIAPGTLMPDLGVKPDEARAIVAYLYGR